MTITKTFLFLLLSGWGVLCSSASLIVLGDSLSANYGISQEQGWVHLLEQKLKKAGYSYQIINASISGDTTSNGKSRLPRLLEEYQPDIVIIELGANDGLRGLSLAISKKNLADMIAMAQAAKAKVLLVGMRIPENYGPVYTQDFYQLYADLAKQYAVERVPFLLDNLALNSKMFQTDGIHPTAQAQPILFENVWPHLEKLLEKTNVKKVQ